MPVQNSLLEGKVHGFREDTDEVRSCGRIRANLELGGRFWWGDTWVFHVFMQGRMRIFYWHLALSLTEVVGDSHQLDRGKKRILFPMIHRPILSLLTTLLLVLWGWAVARDRVWGKHPGAARGSESFPAAQQVWGTPAIRINPIARFGFGKEFILFFFSIPHCSYLAWIILERSCFSLWSGGIIRSSVLLP